MEVVATETPTTATIAIQSPHSPCEVVNNESEESDTDESEDSHDADDTEIILYTSSPTTLRRTRLNNVASPSVIRRTSSPATREMDSGSSKPMLCTPTMMQRIASASTSSEGQPVCLICLEPMPLGEIMSAPPVRVSNIPVGLVCDCTVHAHSACLERWLQRTLACPICHCAAQFRPRPGQVVRTFAANNAYQRLLEREDTRELDYVWEIRRRQCVHFLQCSCALGFLGMLAWAFAAYSAISSPPSR